MDYDSIRSLLERARPYWWIPVLSLLMLVLVLIGSAVAVILIPADYFQARRPSLVERLKDSSLPMCAFLLLKNLFAFVFLIAGILMLVLPGQGLLAILVALFLLDFPGKKKFERWIVKRTAIRNTVNWLRRRFDRAELKID